MVQRPGREVGDSRFTMQCLGPVIATMRFGLQTREEDPGAGARKPLLPLADQPDPRLRGSFKVLKFGGGRVVRTYPVRCFRKKEKIEITHFISIA